MKASKIMILGLLVVGMASMGAAQVDDFEDGDITSNPSWSGDTGVFSASTTHSKSGSYSAVASYTAGENNFYDITGPNLPDQADKGEIATAWVKPDTNDETNKFSGNGNEWWQIHFDENGDIVARFNGKSDQTLGSYTGGNWYHAKVNATSSSSIRLSVEDENGNLIGSHEYTNINHDIDNIRLLVNNEGTGNYVAYDLASYDWRVPNNPPEFNSTSLSPDPPLIGENVSYSAEVYDPDGSIQNTTLNVTGVISYEETRTGTTPSWSNLPQPQSDGWLNATFTTYDNDGATNTTTLNRYLADDPPDVAVTSPGNTTLYDYDVTVAADVNLTGDSVPNENATCDIYNDNTLVGSQSGTDQFSVSVDDSHDFGDAINASVFCTDDGGNTGSDDVFYSIDLFNIDSTASDSPVFETDAEDYTTTLTLGDMVNSVNNTLQWQGEYRDFTYDGSPTQGSNTYTLSQNVPLVTANNTDVDWYNRFTINYTEFNGGTTTQTNETDNVTQSVYHSYSFDQAFLDPINYTANQTYNFIMDINNQSSKASLLGTDTYHRFNSQQVMDITDTSGGTVRFKGNQDVGDADNFENKDFNVSGEVKVSFEDRERYIQSTNETLTVYTIQLTDCSGSGTEALRFNSYREQNITESVHSDLEFSVKVINTAGGTRVYNFTSTDKTSHTFCIKPATAEYTINNLDGKQIIYDDGNSTTEAYAARNYWIINETLDNSSITTIPLYLIETSISDPITFEVRDSSNEPYPGVYGRVNRYYPGVDKEVAVAMFRTGEEGQDRIPVATTSEDHYRFQVFDETDLILETTRQSLVESPKILNVEDPSTPTYYRLIGQYGSSCTENVYSVNCSYTSESESLDNATLTVEREDFTGTTTVCQQSGQTLTGQLICTGLNASTQEYTYTLQVEDDGNTFVINDGSFGTANDDFGLTGLMAALVLILSLGFAGLYDPRAMVALTIVGVVASSFTNLLALTTATTISFVAVGLIVLWRIR